MTLEDFKSTLKKTGFTKKTFSEEVGISLSTVNSWGSANKPPIPNWVEKYLHLHIANKDYKALKQVIKDSVCKDD